MFQHATITNVNRKMTLAFDGPMLPNDEHDTYEWHERIKVTCTHNTTKKRYEAHVSWCKAAERNGYGVEQHAIFTDPYLFIMCSAPVGRFNENKFGAFCTEAQDRCMEMVNDANDTSDAANLLRKAVSFALVKN